MKILSLVACLILGSNLPVAAFGASSGPRQGIEVEQRGELARLAVELAALELDDASGQRPALKEQMRKLMQAIGGVSSDREAVALIRSVLEQHTPEALPLFEKRERERLRVNTRGSLQNIQAALLQYADESGQLPSTAEGLLALMEASHDNEPLLYPSMVRDGWGQVIQYKQTQDMEFELRSIGPDGESETGDDVIADHSGLVESNRQASKPSPYSVRITSGDDRLDRFMLGPEGKTLAYRVKRGEQEAIGTMTGEHEMFDRVSWPQFTSAGGHVVYTAETDDDHYLVADGKQHPISPPFFDDCRLVEDSPFFGVPVSDTKDGIYWVIGNGEWIQGANELNGEIQSHKPVFDGDNRCLAVRFRIGKKWFMQDKGILSEGHRWVSQPVPLPGGGQVSYRTTSLTQTRVIVAGKVIGTHDWARDPVFSADAAHVAYAINEGGVPGFGYEKIRDLDRRSRGNRFLLDSPAYDLGSYHIVYDGAVGPAFAYVRDPILNAAGTSIAYAAKLAEDRWAVVQNGRVGDVYDRVGLLMYSGDGSTLAYVVWKGDEAYLIVGKKKWGPFTRLETLKTGSGDSFAYVTVDANHKRTLWVNSESSGPYDSVGRIRFLADGRKVIAEVERGEQHAMCIDGQVRYWFDDILREIVGPKEQVIVYAGRRGDSWHMVVNGELSQEFDSVTKPVVLGGGRVLYVGNLGGERADYGDGYSTGEGLTNHLVTRNSIGPPIRTEGRIEVSPNGQRAFLEFQREKGPELTVEIGADFALSKPLPGAYAVFDHNNQLVIVHKTREWTRLVIDGVAGPAFDDLYIMNSDASSPLLCSVTEKGKSAYMLGDKLTPAFAELDDHALSPDGESITCRGSDGQGWHLIINQWTGPVYDQIFDPVFSEDGRWVLCAARQGDQLYALRIAVPE